MNSSVPSNWGEAQSVDHNHAAPAVTTAGDSLTLLYEALGVEMHGPAAPLVAAVSTAVYVPWQLAGRVGFRGFAVDIRGFAEGGEGWRGDLVVQVGGTVERYELGPATAGEFMFSLRTPPPPAGAGPVPVLFSAHLTMQRADAGSDLIGRVDSLDVQAEFAAADEPRAVQSCRCKATFSAEVAVRELSRDLARVVDLLTSGTVQPPSDDRAAPAEQAALAGVAGYLQILADHRSKPSAAGVVGGEITRDYPSCCYLRGDLGSCSGVLVRPRVVLTAAHCGASIPRVFIGGWDIDHPEDGELVDVAAVVRHPGYDGRANDISVLILAEDAATTPVALATDKEIATAKDCAIVGFGYDDPTRPLGLGYKREVSVPVVAIRRRLTDDLTEAAGQLGFDPDFEFVAGRKGLGRDSCNGDSGGPAYLLTTKGARLLGLTSRATPGKGVRCGDGGIYVLPARHLAWIRGILADHGIHE